MEPATFGRETELELHDDEFELSPAAVERIVTSIDTPKPIKATWCEMAAIGYRTELDALMRSTGRGTRADLRKLKATMSSAADLLAGTRLQVSLTVGVHASLRNPQGVSGIRRVRQLTTELRWFAGAIADAEQALRRPVADFDVGMTIALTLLADAFEAATGKPPTHSTHKDGEYVGRPLSLFGQLVVAFFREVHPALTETQISTAIRKHLDGRRRDRAVS